MEVRADCAGNPSIHRVGRQIAADRPPRTSHPLRPLLPISGHPWLTAPGPFQTERVRQGDANDNSPRLQARLHVASGARQGEFEDRSRTCVQGPDARCAPGERSGFCQIGRAKGRSIRVGMQREPLRSAAHAQTRQPTNLHSVFVSLASLFHIRSCHFDKRDAAR